METVTLFVWIIPATWNGREIFKKTMEIFVSNGLSLPAQRYIMESFICRTPTR